MYICTQVSRNVHCLYSHKQNTFSYIHLQFHIHSRYHSVVGGQKVTWHMQGNLIQSLSGNGCIEARVLTEELAYNKSLQQFKIFILDRPLDPEYRVSHIHTQTHAHTHTQIDTHLLIRTHTMYIRILCLNTPFHFVYFLLTQPSVGSSKIQDSLKVRRTFQEQRGLLFSFLNFRQVLHCVVLCYWKRNAPAYCRLHIAITMYTWYINPITHAVSNLVRE